MSSVRHFVLLSAAVLGLAMGSPALAAPKAASPPATGKVRIGRPITLTWIKDLDFAALRVTAAGSATINADTGAMTTSGGVQQIAGSPQPAEFQIAAARAAILFVTLPSGSVTLTRVGGTQTMTVSNWDLDGLLGIRIIPQNGVLNFKVGARLNVNANQAEGTYIGQFNVTVDYL
ncbi:DUF4402 domain-containing protein [Sphingomonas daechungensis]|uniref:DUF4402 domain-containing protein n=1 Tax=Sphingomonas daechungensis TaxID=1176646 RepID=UPI0037834FEA